MESRAMREDLKERLKKLRNRVTAFCDDRDSRNAAYWGLLDLWSGEDSSSTLCSHWPMKAFCGPDFEYWPDSRVEAFLGAAEAFREK